MTTSDKRKPSRITTREQYTKSSSSLGSCPCDCGRSGQRLTPEPALWWLAPLTTGDLNGQCSGRSPISYPTLRSGSSPAPGPPAASCAGARRRSRIPLSSQIERSHAASVAPLQVLIVTSLYADVRVRERRSTPLIFPFHPHVDFRLCLTFCDRSFSLRFFRSHDRASVVGQNDLHSSTHKRAGLVRLVRQLPGLEAKGVPGRFGNLVSMPARCVRRLPSLVLPNNCVRRARW